MARNCEAYERGIFFLLWDGRHSHKAGPTEGGQISFALLDTGEIDELELDDIIHRYKRAAGKLWTSCRSSGSEWLQAATALGYMRDRGEEHDWWAESERHRDRS